MSSSIKKLGIDQLDVETRLALVEEILESIDDQALPVAAETVAELEARVADVDRHPDQLVSWEEVKRTALPPRKRE